MTEDDGRRKRQRRIWIRVAIYVPLLLYFGWGALQTYRAELAASEAPPAPESVDKDDPFEGLPSSEMTMPDGRKIRVLELSPEQAEELGLAPPDPPSMEAPPDSETPEAGASDTGTDGVDGVDGAEPAPPTDPPKEP